MAVNIHITIIELNALHTKRQNLFRSEERFSRNAETELVCRLLLEKKNQLLRGVLLHYQRPELTQQLMSRDLALLQRFRRPPPPHLRRASRQLFVQAGPRSPQRYAR